MRTKEWLESVGGTPTLPSEFSRDVHHIGVDEFLLNSIENKTGVVEMQIISLQGRITVGNANEMRRKLADALIPQLPQLTVDLSGVTYMDTSGLATLMEAMRIARRQGTRLVLSGIQDQPRYLLEITDLDQVFEIEKAAKT